MKQMFEEGSGSFRQIETILFAHNAASFHKNLVLKNSSPNPMFFVLVRIVLA